MSRDFLLQLEKEIAEGGDKESLAEQAWAWFDSQHFPEKQANKIRRQLEKLLHIEEVKLVATPRFTNLLDVRNYPTTGWLAKYVAYTDFCGAPLPFHFFVGATVLGAALKREAWIPFGRSPTFAAMYTVLIAPPGCCYKSTAIRIGIGLLREANSLKIISGRATPEALSNILSYKENEPKKDAIAIIAASELYRFLAGHNTPANSQIVSAMTSWYDAETEDDDITITRDERKLANIAISLLGGSTLDWLVEALPKSVFAGGFMSRILFVVQEHTDRIRPVSPPDNPLLRTELLEDLQEIQESYRGPKDFTPEALELYNSWFLEHYKFLTNADERTADFYQRRADYVRKMALVLSASEQHEAIAYSDVKWAIHVLELLSPALDSVMTPISLGESGFAMDLIRRTVEKFGEISRTELQRKCCGRGIDRDKMDRALDTLKVADLIEEDIVGKRGGRLYKWLGK